MKYLNYFHINENVASAKALLVKNNLTEENEGWKHIRQLLKGHDGYVFWFFNQYITNEVPLEELDRIWSTIKQDNSILSLFKIDLIKLKTAEDFWDEYGQAVIKKRVRKLYNEFPSKQKKFFNLNNDDDVQILDSLAQDPSHNSIITKISVFKSKDSLLAAINRLVNNKTGTEFNKLIDKLETLNCPIVYASKEDDIIITSVDYNAILKLGADTAWCIVRSEHTFNSYVSGDLGIQYIIFLLDVGGNSGKIGLTVNINGFSTAHLKNDEYIDKTKLEVILNERGTNIKDLYPKKEDVTQNSLDNASVEGLLAIGFTKEEILERKNKFKSRNVYRNGRYELQADLDNFTKEEIEKYNLLDKTELNITDFNTFTVDEIVEKNLLNRLAGGINDYNINQVLDLGFNLTNIDKILNNFPKSFKKIVKKAKSFEKRTDLVKYVTDKYYDDVHRDQRDAMAITLVKLCKIGPKDLKWNRIVSLLHSEFKDKDLIQRIEFLNHLGYKIDETLVKEQFPHNVLKTYSYAISIITQKPELGEKFPNLIDTCIEIINNNLLDTYLDSIDIENLTTIKGYLVSYPEVYSNIYNSYKQYYLPKLYYLRDRKSGMSTDIRGTIKNLQFYGYNSNDVTLDDLIDVFKREVSSYEMNDVLTYLNKTGYELAGEEAYKFVMNSFNTNTSTMDRLIFCIENEIHVEYCYDKLIEYVDGLKSPLSKYDKDKVKNVIAKSDKYKDAWEERENADRINRVLAFTLASSKYWSGSSVRGESTLSPEKWYEEYFEELKDININKRQDAYKYAIGAVVLLASMDKFEDLKYIKYDFLNTRSDSHGDRQTKGSLVDICKIVAQMKVTNWNWTWRIYLNPEQRKGIYEWIDKLVDTDPTLENRSAMQVCYYLYDKEKYNKLFTDIKKFKSNFTKRSWGRDDKLKETPMTNRVLEFKPIIQYLAQRGKFEDIKNVLKVFKSIGLYKIEKESLKSLRSSNLFYSKADDSKDTDVYIGRLDKDYSVKLKEVIDEFLQTLNESRIVKWNDFI